MNVDQHEAVANAFEVGFKALSAPIYAEDAARYPLHGVANARVVDRKGTQDTVPIIVVDFYREHGKP